MKPVKNILAVAFILLLASCNKDSSEMNTLKTLKTSEIPESVKENFKAEHPNINDAKWEKEGDYFEAEFEEKGVEKSVVYDNGGNIMATETEIDVADLPTTVNEYIDNNYSSYTIEEAEKEKKTEKGTYYEVELESGDQEIDLVFDSKGNFIEKESEDDNDKEEGDDNENENENDDGGDDNENENDDDDDEDENDD